MKLDTILHGDCLELLPTLSDASIDAIVTDPPYFRVKSAAWDRQWESRSAFLAWIDALCVQWRRVLKPNGSLYVFASPQMAAHVEVTLAKHFTVLNHIVWEKGPYGRHASAHKEGLRGYFPNTERVIFAEQQGADSMALGESGYAAQCERLHGFVFEPLRAYLDGERRRAGIDFETVRHIVGCANGSGLPSHWFTSSQWALPTLKHYTMLQKASGYFSRSYESLRSEYESLRSEYESLRSEYESLRRPFAVTADVPYTDVWTFATVPPRPGKHPCEKPLDLCQHIIRTSTRPGDVILDCFAGSGAILDAAQREGRRFVGMEQEAQWVATARRRIGKAMPVLVTSHVKAPTQPAAMQQMTLWNVA